MFTASFEPHTSGLIARHANGNSISVWAVVSQEFALHPGIQGTVNGKVQWLETSDNNLCEAR